MNNNYIDLAVTVHETFFVLLDCHTKVETRITNSEAETWYYNKGYARWSDRAVTYMEEVILNPEPMQI
jgi:hypothetical protein